MFDGIVITMVCAAVGIAWCVTARFAGGRLMERIAWDDGILTEDDCARRVGDDRGSRRAGLASTLASVTSFVRNGGDVVAAFEERRGRGFAVRELNARRLRMVYEASAAAEELNEVDEMAAMTAAACSLSRVLGCSMVRCLDAVADRHRHAERMRRLRESAFAMPRATVRLLSALPLLTVAVGMALGARPLAFLLDGGVGSVCLLAGAWCHAAGMVWLRALFERSGEAMG